MKTFFLRKYYDLFFLKIIVLGSQDNKSFLLCGIRNVFTSFNFSSLETDLGKDSAPFLVPDDRSLRDGFFLWIFGQHR